MILEGKTVVVTGVGPGLGGEVAKLVLRDGGNAVLAARSADKLEAIAGEVDPSGERVAHLPTDIGDVEQCRALAKLAVDRFGAVDGVVQVAAYDGLLAGLEGTSDDDWHAVLDTNVVGSMHVITAMSEAMAGCWRPCPGRRHEKIGYRRQCCSRPGADRIKHSAL